MDEIDNTHCFHCKVYFSSDDSRYCSTCRKVYSETDYDKTIFNNYEYVNNNYTQEEIDYLYENICQQFKDDLVCVCCFKKTRCFNKFICKCIPTACINCKEIVDVCPLCKAPKLLIVLPDHLRSLIKNKFSTISLIKFIKKVCNFNNYKGDVFKFEQCIMKSDIILDTVAPYYKNILNFSTYTEMSYFNHTRCWGFAFDFWNVPDTLPHMTTPNYMYCSNFPPSTSKHNFIKGNELRKNNTSLMTTKIEL